MNIQGFEPKRAMQSLRNDIDTLFDRFVERPLGVITGQVVPAIDIYETDSEVILEAEVPGTEEDNIDISISDEILTIKGQKQKDDEQPGNILHVTERSYGSFSRSIRLPANVKPDEGQASCKNGVLKIIIPKQEVKQAKKIEIKTSNPPETAEQTEK